MFRSIANALLEGVRFIVGSIAILVAWIGVKLHGGKGIYSVVPVLLAPMVVLHFLHLGDDREF